MDVASTVPARGRSLHRTAEAMRLVPGRLECTRGGDCTPVGRPPAGSTRG